MFSTHQASVCRAFDCFVTPFAEFNYRHESGIDFNFDSQLRVIAEFFTLLSFIGFSVFYLREPMSVNFIVSFALIFAAVYFAFWGPFK